MTSTEPSHASRLQPQGDPISNLAARTDLPEALGRALAAFEAIRQLARRYEDREPDLFAAFMSAASAAAEGRDAILTASALPTPDVTAVEIGTSAPDAKAADVADMIAAEAAALAVELDRAVTLARSDLDRRACHDAATAARQIHQLLAAEP